MTLEEKIDFTKTSTETYLKRIRCCSWVFLVTAVWFVGNSLYCFHETREWAHFISASGGKLPWPTPKEEYADIMRSTRDAQPTEAEFALYNALMLTAGAMLVMGLVFFRQSKMARRAAWKQKERPVARKVFGSLICLGLFFACYGVSKYSCGEVKHIAKVLQNNGTIEAPPMMQPRDHEHHHGEHHGHHDRHLEEWDGESADWEAEEFDHPRHEGHHGDHEDQPAADAGLRAPAELTLACFKGDRRLHRVAPAARSRLCGASSWLRRARGHVLERLPHAKRIRALALPSRAALETAERDPAERIVTPGRFGAVDAQHTRLGEACTRRELDLRRALSLGEAQIGGCDRDDIL